MSQDNLAKLECTECHRVTHHTYRNPKSVKERLQQRKHCKWCGKHTLHKETK